MNLDGWNTSQAAKGDVEGVTFVYGGRGGVLMVPIDLIDEDPDQPRSQDNPGFRAESIAELAASYGPKGPKTPLSLRDNLAAPGRYIINHGHRRYRAGKIKGLTHLPAFIDNEYEDADQVIENLQRENMTPREIADYIGRELAKGKRKRDITERIGKSASFVSQHVTLLDLPEPIASVFNRGRVNDVTLVNELVTAFRTNPSEVEAWLSTPSQEVTRSGVKLLREYLAQKSHNFSSVAASTAETDEETEATGRVTGSTASELRHAPEKFRGATVIVEHGGRKARLLLDRRPSATGRGWLLYDDGQQEEAALADLRLLALLEGR